MGCTLKRKWSPERLRNVLVRVGLEAAAEHVDDDTPHGQVSTEVLLRALMEITSMDRKSREECGFMLNALKVSR